MNAKKKRILSVALVILGVLLVCTFLSKTIYHVTLPKVTVTKAFPATFRVTATLTSGQLVYDNVKKLELDPPVPLVVEEVYISVGHIIEEGDAIARFDQKSMTGQIENLQEKAESAEIMLKEFRHGFASRVASLRESISNAKRNGVSAGTAEQELDFLLTTGIYNGRTEAQLARAFEKVERDLTALKQLSESCFIYAVERGIVSAVNLHNGMPFSGGVVMEYAMEDSPRSLVFRSGDMTVIRPEQRCTIISMTDGKQIKSMSEIQDVRSGQAWVAIPEDHTFDGNAQAFLAEVVLTERTSELALPTSALINSDEVYVVQERKGIFGTEYFLELRRVVSFQYDDRNTEIIKGLEYYDLVVTGWDQSIAAGMVVEILES